jgi:kynurenine formamidase
VSVLRPNLTIGFLLWRSIEKEEVIRIHCPKPEHCGTHMDAPAHFAEGKWRIGDVPFQRLIGPGVVVDIEQRAKLVLQFKIFF